MTTTASTTLSPVSDPADWTGADIASGEGWKHVLSPDEVDALRTMAAELRPRVEGNPNRLMQLTQTDCKLGTFARRLEAVYEGLKNGLGIALIRGLPADEMDRLELATIYWAVGCHLGSARPNNPEGDVFGHITDLGKTQADPNSRGYQTREAMDYHCDQCDIVGLLCIRTAKSGGVSKVASSVAMYNSLLQEYPEYAETLTRPFCWTKHGEHAPEEAPYYTSPVFNFVDGQLCTSFGPKHILKGHNLPETPALTETQTAALRTAEDVAERDHYAMSLEPGDMQFINNYVALHTRSEYVDHEDPAKRRLLWRLWLMNPDLRHRTDYTTQWEKGVQMGQTTMQIRV